MTIPAELSPAQRRHFYRRAALAPLCLCLVAALHLVRVWTCQQTPWKGGGFGMFSTVDDESSRFLRCYLVTGDGDIPLAIPEAAAKSVAEIRAAPTIVALDTLAQRLAAQPWRWRDQHQQDEAAAIAALGGKQITAAVLRNAVNHTVYDARSFDAANPGNQSVLEPIPRDESSVSAIPHTAIRLECWRYRFDAGNSELRAEPILSVAAKAPTENTGNDTRGDASP